LKDPPNSNIFTPDRLHERKAKPGDRPALAFLKQYNGKKSQVHPTNDVPSPFALMLGMDVKTPGYSRSAHVWTGKVLSVSGIAAIALRRFFYPERNRNHDFLTWILNRMV